MISPATKPVSSPHKRWVRVSHGIVALSFFVLLVSGFVILMCHPRLYWGEVGNDLTPAIIELPVSKNYQHGGWDKSTRFYNVAGSPVTASRTFDIFNQNSWGRSLHFLGAWILTLTGLCYLTAGVISGHFRHNILPRAKDATRHLFWQDVRSHLRMQVTAATKGLQYGLLQKLTYSFVLFALFPLVIITGLTMSPAITAAFPFLLDISGGFQSARTIHFFTSTALVLFVIVHVVMVARSGFKKQIKAITIGKTR